MPRRLLLASSLLVLPALSPGAADAASFILRDGEVVDGRLVTATRNTLTVVRDIGGIRQLPINALEQVRVETPRGTVTGTISGTDGKRILIATPAGNRVWIEGDQVVAEAEPERVPFETAEVRWAGSGQAPPTSADTPAPGGSDPDRPERSVAEAANAAPAKPRPPLADAGPRPGGRGLAPGRSFGGLVSEAAAAPAGETPAATPSEPPLIRIAVTSPEIGEQAGQVGFRIELSHASPEPIRLVYSTVDGQASAGQDYQPSQGVFTLAPGETARSIETVILDDGETEDPEQFFLFVTTDTEHATLQDKWYSVTIQDDD